MSPTLEEATAKQLAEELFIRFDSACFIGIRQLPGTGEKVLHAGHSGPGEYAIGLLRSYVARLETAAAKAWDEALEDDGDMDWMDTE